MIDIVDREPDDTVRVLDEDGEIVDGATVPDVDDDTLLDMYAAMKLGRTFDRRAVSLQRQGRLGTYPPMAGQEGAQVGSAMALADDDWTFPSYREHAANYVRGMPLDRIVLYWMGHEAGNAAPEDVNVFANAIPIGTQLPHAVGAAWASKLRDEARAFTVYFGDGATSEGDFHEAMNFAGVFDTPSIFFCNNNQWAISVPRERQTASETIAQKAVAYGFPGVQVDGMDPLAVYAVTDAAAGRARQGDGDVPRPTLVEAIQYRFGAHTTADDPSVYRDETEVEKWRQRDPIPRLESFLRRTGRLDDETVDAIESRVEEEVDAAVRAAEETVPPEPEDIFDCVYADLPDRLLTQQAHLASLLEEHGDEAFVGE